MGQAKQRGTREQRIQAANVLGRVKEDDRRLKIYKYTPGQLAVFNTLFGPFQRAAKIEEPKE